MSRAKSVSKTTNPPAADSVSVGVVLPRVEPVKGKPLYLVARDALRQAVDEGKFAPGERMPSTAQISRLMNVSLVTAHRALGELVDDGVLRRSQGRGTFVRPVMGDRGTPRAAGRIGLVFHRESSLADHYHSQILEGVRRGAQQLHVDLILLRFDEDVKGECDGFLYVNPLPSELEDVQAHAKKRPRVVVGASGGVAGVAAVDTDNADLAEQAVEHLKNLGHTRLAYVGGGDGPEATSNARDRWQGFAKACDARSMTPQPRHVLHADHWQLSDGEKSRLVRMLTAPNRPTAILAAGYYYALDVYAAALTAGLRLPEDLSVVGIDDPPSAAHLSPSLTTFRQPLVQLGYAAVAMLVDRLAPDAKPDDEPSADRTLRARLVARNSSGPAPGL